MIQGVISSNNSTRPLGIIFNKTSFPNLTGFVVSGASSITAVSNEINISSGTASFDDFIAFNDSTNKHRYTCLEKWKQKIRLKTPTVFDGSSFGIGLGVRSANTYGNNQYQTVIRWAWDSGFVGQLFLYTISSDGTTGGYISNQMVSSGTYTPSTNTYYDIEIERIKNVITYTIFSTGGLQLFTTSFTCDLTGGYKQAHNTGRFVVQNFGGTNVKVASWYVESNENKNADVLLISDSIGYGAFAGSTSNRYFEQSANGKKLSFVIQAGFADRSQEILLRIPEVIALSPSYAVLCFLGNDVNAGISSGTYQANFNAIVSQLETGGVRVKMATPTALNSSDVSTAATFVLGKRGSGYSVADFRTATKAVSGTGLNSSLDSGDGLHPNLAGNNAMKTSLDTIL